MALLDTLKEAGNIVIDTIKENPVVAGAVVATAVVVGGGVYLYKNKKDKEAEARVKAVIKEYIVQEDEVEQTTKVGEAVSA